MLEEVIQEIPHENKVGDKVLYQKLNWIKVWWKPNYGPYTVQ